MYFKRAECTERLFFKEQALSKAALTPRTGRWMPGLTLCSARLGDAVLRAGTPGMLSQLGRVAWGSRGPMEGAHRGPAALGSSALCCSGSFVFPGAMSCSKVRV